jgi:hypothetical protein
VSWAVVLLSALLWSAAVVTSHDHDHNHNHVQSSYYPDMKSPLATYKLTGSLSITEMQQSCELEALNLGTRLADRYNSFDEATDWDIRIHHDYLTKYLGFAGWIQMGLWKNTGLTAMRQHAATIHKVFILFIWFSCLFS